MEWQKTKHKLHVITRQGLGVANSKLYYQAASLIQTENWIKDPRQRIVKLETADLHKGLYNYLWIEKLTKKIITQERCHVV